MCPLLQETTLDPQTWQKCGALGTSCSLEVFPAAAKASSVVEEPGSGVF